jgi:Putative prokaryotic signal transducing protein
VGRVKIVYRAENIIDANLVKAALAQEGIEAFVAGEYLTGAIGQLPAWDLVTVMVAETDVERAAPIAQAVDADLRENRKAADAIGPRMIPI